MNSFLAISLEDLAKRGWDGLDIILVSGDAYVDHPSYGPAGIGRVLEHAGWLVGIISQPDWKTTADFMKLGRPRLFFGITAGNMDSMVSNYTANKKPRKEDDYAPGGKAGLRPDRAAIVYSNRIREAFPDTPIVLGGIEASLRRFAHYDWWDDKVRRSVLLDTRADILVYGMGERQVLEIADRLASGRDLTGIKGTAITAGTLQESLENTALIPSCEEVQADKRKFNEALKTIYLNQDPFLGKTVVQKHANRYVIQYPPALPFTTEELDALYGLPFMKACHPSYADRGGVPGFETVKFSLISHRGCPGQCSFCALSMHQGRTVQSRSLASIVAEAEALTKRSDFKGTITDVGGPTANLYAASCPSWRGQGACPGRSCLVPQICKNLRPGFREALKVYSAIRALPGVKHLFIESGIRFDLLSGNSGREYLEHLCRYHVSGQMKVAPEHCSSHLLKLMNKPSFDVYEAFASQFADMNRHIGKNQHLVHYFISAHPGSTLEDALQLSLTLMKKGIYPEQIQDFMALPMTISGAMYHTGEHPLTGERLYVPKTSQERMMQRALIQYRHAANRPLVKEALKILGREDLMGRFLGTFSKTKNPKSKIGNRKIAQPQPLRIVLRHPDRWFNINSDLTSFGGDDVHENIQNRHVCRCMPFRCLIIALLRRTSRGTEKIHNRHF